MRFSLFCLLLCGGFTLFAQAASVVSGIYTDAVYVPSRDKIYALTPGVGVDGNSVCRIDPITASVEECFFVGSIPNTLAVTPDDNFLFIGLGGENKVIRFDLATETIGDTLNTGGEDEFLGPFYAEDILPLRAGKADAVAIALQNQGFSPRHEGVAIFTEGEQLMNTTPGHTGSNSITYTDTEGVLIGYNNETTDFALRRMVVDDDGISVTGEYQLFDGFDHRIEYAEGQVYSTNGQRANLTNGVPSLAGRFVFPGDDFQFRAVEPLPNIDRVAFVHEFIFGTYRLELFDRTTSSFLEFRDYVVDGATGRPLELIRLGSDEAMAFVTQDGQLVILNSCTAMVSAPDEAPVATDSIQPCFGDTRMLTPAKGAPLNGAVVWEDGTVGDTLTVTETGVYRYAFADENGCTTGFSPGLFVEFVAPPFTPELFYNAEGNVLASSFFGRNRWYFNGNLVAETPDAFYEPEESGFYTVVAIDPCPSEPSNPVSVIISGTEDPELRSRTSIYPNPLGSDNRLNIQTTVAIDYRVSLYDLNGRRLLSGENMEVLELSGLPAGTYVLELTEMASGRFLRELVVK